MRSQEQIAPQVKEKINVDTRGHGQAPRPDVRRNETAIDANFMISHTGNKANAIAA